MTRAKDFIKDMKGIIGIIQTKIGYFQLNSLNFGYLFLSLSKVSIFTWSTSLLDI